MVDIFHYEHLIYETQVIYIWTISLYTILGKIILSVDWNIKNRNSVQKKTLQIDFYILLLLFYAKSILYMHYLKTIIKIKVILKKYTQLCTSFFI